MMRKLVPFVKEPLISILKNKNGVLEGLGFLKIWKSKMVMWKEGKVEDKKSEVGR